MSPPRVARCLDLREARYLWCDGASGPTNSGMSHGIRWLVLPGDLTQQCTEISIYSVQPQLALSRVRDARWLFPCHDTLTRCGLRLLEAHFHQECRRPDQRVALLDSHARLVAQRAVTSALMRWQSMFGLGNEGGGPIIISGASYFRGFSGLTFSDPPRHTPPPLPLHTLPSSSAQIIRGLLEYGVKQRRFTTGGKSCSVACEQCQGE